MKLSCAIAASALCFLPNLAQAACDEVSYVPENPEVTFSPQQLSCLDVGVEGSSTVDCPGAFVTFRNRCTGPAVFVTWKFVCDENPAGCDQLPAGQSGKIAIDVVQRETASFTFDGNVGTEVVQVVVAVEIDEVTPGCNYAPAANNRGWSASLVALLGLSLLRRRRPRSRTVRASSP